MPPTQSSAYFLPNSPRHWSVFLLNLRMLINACVYENGKEVPSGHTWPEVYASAMQPKRFSWLGLRDASNDEIDTIGTDLELHDLVIEDIKSGGQTPKFEDYPNYLFVVCKQAKWSPDGGLEEGDISIVVNPKHLVTFRRGAGEGLAAIRKWACSEPNLLERGAGYALYTILDTVVDRYFPIVKDFEAEFDRLEDRVFGEDLPDSSAPAMPREKLTSRLYHLRREVVRFRGLVEPLSEVSFKMFSGRIPALCDGLGEYYRDIHDHLVRIVARLDALITTIGSAVQAQLTLTAIEESKVNKRLAGTPVFLRPIPCGWDYGA